MSCLERLCKNFDTKADLVIEICSQRAKMLIGASGKRKADTKPTQPRGCENYNLVVGAPTFGWGDCKTEIMAIEIASSAFGVLAMTR